MAQPITWHNVNGPNLADSLRPMETAQRSFNGAFDGLAGLLKQRETLDQANWDNTKVNNTNAFQDQLMQYRTPEALQAAQQAGLLDQQRLGYGAQVDRAAIRASEDARLGILQDRAVKAGVYLDGVTEREQRGLRDQIMAADARGDKVTSAALRAANPQLANQAGLTEYGNTQAARITSAATAAAAEAHKANMRPNELVYQKGTIAAQGDALLNSESTRQLQASNITLNNAKAAAEGESTEPSKRAAAARKASLAELFKTSLYGAGDYSTADGKKSVLEGLKGMGFKEAQVEDTLYNLGKEFPNGIPVGEKNGKMQYKPVPVNLILDAASKSEENSLAFPGMGFSRRGDNLVNIISGRLRANGDLINEMHSSSALQGEMLDPSGALRATYQGGGPKAAPEGAWGDKPVGPATQESALDLANRKFKERTEAQKKTLK